MKQIIHFSFLFFALASAGCGKKRYTKQHSIRINMNDSSLDKVTKKIKLNPKTIYTGSSDFKELVLKSDAFIDKTLFIKQIIEDNKKSFAIYMPRRWGKSTNLDMLCKFLTNREINKNFFVGGKEKYKQYDFFPEEKHIEKSLLIKEKPNYEKILNKTPVIYLSFKNCIGKDYNSVIESIKTKIRNCFLQHDNISNPLIKDWCDSNDYKKKSEDDIKSDLLELIRILNKEYKQKVWVLIDEYDAILNDAFNNFVREKYLTNPSVFESGSTFQDIRVFLQSMLGPILKPDEVIGESIIAKSILTGILPIANKEMLSGSNNIIEYSLYDKFYGFDQNEVTYLIEKLEKTNIDTTQLKNLANGYSFGDKNDIYNPWSVVNHLMDPKKDEAWKNSGGLNLIKDLLSKNDMQEALQKLIKGESLNITKEAISYKNLLDGNLNTFLNVLVYTGYLTPIEYNIDNEKKVKIPNEPVRDIFKEEILKWAIGSKSKASEFL